MVGSISYYNEYFLHFCHYFYQLLPLLEKWQPASCSHTFVFSYHFFRSRQKKPCNRILFTFSLIYLAQGVHVCLRGGKGGLKDHCSVPVSVNSQIDLKEISQPHCREGGEILSFLRLSNGNLSALNVPLPGDISSSFRFQLR